MRTGGPGWHVAISKNFSAVLVARTRQSSESRVRGAFVQGAELFRVWFWVVPGAKQLRMVRMTKKDGSTRNKQAQVGTTRLFAFPVVRTHVFETEVVV